MPLRAPRLGSSRASSEKQRKRQIDRRRGSAAGRGYNAAWRKVRIGQLSREPLCRFCKERGKIVAATVVDHIEAIESRPDLRLDPSNLRSLCKRHHDERTAAEHGFNRGKQARPKGGCDASGMPTSEDHPWNR